MHACLQYHLKHVQPRIVLLIVHEPPRYGAAGLKRLQAMHPNAILAALSPHVVDFTQRLSNNTVKLAWWLDALPFRPTLPVDDSVRAPCEAHVKVAANLQAECLSGFVVQVRTAPHRCWGRAERGAEGRRGLRKGREGSHAGMPMQCL